MRATPADHGRLRPHGPGGDRGEQPLPDHRLPHVVHRRLLGALTAHPHPRQPGAGRRGDLRDRPGRGRGLDPQPLPAGPLQGEYRHRPGRVARVCILMILML